MLLACSVNTLIHINSSHLLALRCACVKGPVWIGPKSSSVPVLHAKKWGVSFTQVRLARRGQLRQTSLGEHGDPVSWTSQRFQTEDKPRSLLDCRLGYEAKRFCAFYVGKQAVCFLFRCRQKVLRTFEKCCCFFVLWMIIFQLGGSCVMVSKTPRYLLREALCFGCCFRCGPGYGSFPSGSPAPGTAITKHHVFFTQRWTQREWRWIVPPTRDQQARAARQKTPLPKSKQFQVHSLGMQFISFSNLGKDRDESSFSGWSLCLQAVDFSPGGGGRWRQRWLVHDSIRPSQLTAALEYQLTV